MIEACSSLRIRKSRRRLDTLPIASSGIHCMGHSRELLLAIVPIVHESPDILIVDRQNLLGQFTCLVDLTLQGFPLLITWRHILIAERLSVVSERGSDRDELLDDRLPLVNQSQKRIMLGRLDEPSL